MFYDLLTSLCFGIAYPLAGVPIKEIGFQNNYIYSRDNYLIYVSLLWIFYKKTKIDFKIYFDIKTLALSVLPTITVILFF